MVHISRSIQMASPNKKDFLSYFLYRLELFNSAPDNTCGFRKNFMHSQKSFFGTIHMDKNNLQIENEPLKNDTKMENRMA